MIWESSPWKNELLAIANKLRKRQTSRIWQKRSDFLLEKELFFGFYAIRKLIESEKLSNDAEEWNVYGTSYPLREIPTVFNWHQIDRHFYLENPSPFCQHLKWVTNLFIHSYIFLPCFYEKNGLSGVLLTSDNGIKKDKKLYQISTETLIQTFECIGNDEVVLERSQRNLKTGQFESVRVRGPRDPNAVEGDLANYSKLIIEALTGRA